MVQILENALCKLYTGCSLIIFLEKDKTSFTINGKPHNADKKGILVFFVDRASFRIKFPENIVKNTYCVMIPNYISLIDPEMRRMGFYIRKFIADGYLFLHYPEDEDFEVDYIKVLLKKVQTLQTELGSVDRELENKNYMTLIKALTYETYDIAEKNMRGKKERIVSDSSLFLDFLHLIDANIGNKFNVDFYATGLNITRSRLQKMCNSVCGCPPKELLNKAVVNKAKDLLTLTNKSIKEIAYDLGFSEPTNFNKFFLKQERKTPKNYRRETIGKWN